MDGDHWWPSLSIYPKNGYQASTARDFKYLEYALGAEINGQLGSLDVIMEHFGKHHDIKPDTPINVYTRFCLSTAKSKFFLVSPVAGWWKTITNSWFERFIKKWHYQKMLLWNKEALTLRKQCQDPSMTLPVPSFVEQPTADCFKKKRVSSRIEFLEHSLLVSILGKRLRALFTKPPASQFPYYSIATVPSLKPSMGEWSLEVLPAGGFIGNGQ